MHDQDTKCQSSHDIHLNAPDKYMYIIYPFLYAHRLEMNQMNMPPIFSGDNNNKKKYIKVYNITLSIFYTHFLLQLALQEPIPAFMG